MTAQTTSSTQERFSYMGTYDSVEQILESFRPVIHAIAAAGGPGCEVVLHDLSAPEPDLGSTIVAIENGHVTGREVGGPSTSLGAEVLHNQDADHNAFGYRGLTSDGREVRCSSVYFRNPQGRIIAALCINFDVSTIAQAKGLLEGLLPDNAPEPAQAPNEFIGRDLVAVMDAMVSQAIREIGKSVDRMTRDEKITILSRLDAQGVLQMRKGVENVAARLGISRVTAYSYLDEARTNAEAVKKSAQSA